MKEEGGGTPVEENRRGIPLEFLVKMMMQSSEIHTTSLKLREERCSSTDPYLGGAGYVIFRDGKEILAGAETIPFGTNNMGEFKGCFLGLKNARGLGSHIQIVGDCMILTKTTPKNHNISNHKLNLLLIEIKATAARFEDAEFIHIFHELNKCADAIATAASRSVMDRIAVVNDLKWNPHIKQVGKTEEEWIVDNSLL